MGRTLLGIVGLAGVALGLGGCSCGVRGSGQEVREDRQVNLFEEIIVVGDFVLDVTASGGPALTISGDDNIVPLVETRVSEGKLEVRTERKVRPRLPLKLTVAVPRLSVVRATGAVRGEVRGLHGESFSLDGSGALSLSITGQIRQLKIKCRGAARVQASELQAEDTVINLAGTGHVEVQPSGLLDVTIAGAGTVAYRGEPRKITQQITGTGRVEPLK